MSSAFDVGSAKGPMSPCISVCALGVDGHCSGCLRTRDEIAGWLRMTAAEQWALIRELDRRREVRDRPRG